MSRKPQCIRLSAGELEILSLLWREGPLSLGAAHERFAQTVRDLGYPTMQTRLNRLVEKGLVTRSAARPAEYAAAVNAEQVGHGHFSELLDRIGRDKAVPLVAQLISENRLTHDEIAELQRMLKIAEQSTRKPDSKGGSK